MSELVNRRSTEEITLTSSTSMQVTGKQRANERSRGVVKRLASSHWTRAIKLLLGKQGDVLNNVRK